MRKSCGHPSECGNEDGDCRWCDEVAELEALVAARSEYAKADQEAERRHDMRMAIICRLVADLAGGMMRLGGSNRPYTMEDFMPTWESDSGATR